MVCLYDKITFVQFSRCIYVCYACTMLVLCLYYVYYLCTMPTMFVLCLLRLLCLYYVYYACAMPTMPVLSLYYACTMATIHVLCLLSLYYAYYLCTMPVLCPVFPLNAKKVRICEIMSGGFAVKIQQCVKKVRQFLVTFSFC